MRYRVRIKLFRFNIFQQWREYMAALDNLKSAIDQLSAKLDLLLAKPQGVAESDVQAAADAVMALSAKIPS